MITEVPTATAVTTPVETLIAAAPGLLLDHVPPATICDRVDVVPAHSEEEPVIAATVNALSAIHPPGNLYVIRTVPPFIPMSTPVTELIDATLDRLVLHVPPDVVLASVVE